jgi:hypothetical protein
LAGRADWIVNGKRKRESIQQLRGELQFRRYIQAYGVKPLLRGKKRKSVFWFGVPRGNPISVALGLASRWDSSAANADSDQQQAWVVLLLFLLIYFGLRLKASKRTKKFLLRTPHGLRTVERFLIAVNRKSYVVLA